MNSEDRKIMHDILAHKFDDMSFKEKIEHICESEYEKKQEKLDRLFKNLESGMNVVTAVNDADVGEMQVNNLFRLMARYWMDKESSEYV